MSTLQITTDPEEIRKNVEEEKQYHLRKLETRDAHFWACRELKKKTLDSLSPLP